MEVIRLNIGGYKYWTKQTLLQHGAKNFFSGLLSETSNFAVVKDEKGFIFIDRNGKYFEPILDYLRTSIWKCPNTMDEGALLHVCKSTIIFFILQTTTAEYSCRKQDSMELI